MTHYRLNEPSAYGPVPGSPINPSREELDMTTADQAQQLDEEVKRIGKERLVLAHQIDALQSEASDLWRRQSMLMLKRDTLRTLLARAQ